MANGKLRLNLEALRLKSFETTADRAAERGTVRGLDSGCGFCTACTGCTNSCGAVTWCVGSCAGGTACAGASYSDSGCEPTWDNTCHMNCSDAC
jgi:hypothetical protein